MLIEYRNVILIHGVVGRQLYGNIPQTNVTMAICSLSFQFACNGNMLLNKNYSLPEIQIYFMKLKLHITKILY